MTCEDIDIYNYNMDLKVILLLTVALLFTQSNLSEYLHAESYNPLEIFTYNTPIKTKPPDNVSRTLFVSGWNSEGKKYALKYAYKFNTIILCIYDLKFTEKSFTILKTKQFDFSFIKQLKRMNKNIKILFRIYVISSSRTIFEYIGSSTKKIGQIATEIVNLVKKYRVHGILYDSDHCLPYKSNFSKVSSYDKFASLLNSYIVNKIKQTMAPGNLVFYALKNPLYYINDIDYHAYSQIKADGFMIATLQNQQYFPLLQSSLRFISQIRQYNSLAQFHIIIPLFSRRNGIGMKTSDIKKYFQTKQIVYKGLSNGVCMFIEKQSKAINLIPCGIYYHVTIDIAKQQNIGVAFYQAGDAIQIQFDLI